MSSRFEEFLRAGVYLRNWSPRTIRTYRQGLALLPCEVPTKSQLDGWVIGMRERGLSAGASNVHIRSVNSYLSWLHEEGHTSTHLRVRVLKASKKHLTLLSDVEIRSLLAHRPRFGELRPWVMLLTLLDSGVRISELLGIERSRVDLDNLTFVVFGKGAKERVVPFSHELRKVLYRWTTKRKAQGKYLFATRTGGKLVYRNVVRDMQKLCARIGIKTHIHPHLCRHQFASSYITRGGDIYRLSRLLGHTSISTTQLYLRSMGIEQVRADYDKLSPLT